MIETVEVQPNPEGSLPEKEAWVKGRQKKRRRGIPALRIKRGSSNSTLNKEATQLLTQEGEAFCYAIVQDGKLRLQPLPMEPGCMGIVHVIPRSGRVSGGFASINPAIVAAIGAKPGERLVGVWDDSEGLMKFEVQRD